MGGDWEESFGAAADCYMPGEASNEQTDCTLRESMRYGRVNTKNVRLLDVNAPRGG